MQVQITTKLGGEFAAIMAKYPPDKLTEGTIVKYTDIEDCINRKKGTSQFQSVVNRWRKKLLREHRIKLLAVANVGYMVANNSQRLNESTRSNAKAMRHARQATVLLQTVNYDKLSEQERKIYDVNQRLNNGLLLASSKERIVPKLL